jgi:RNA polymerase sigma-70 factor (ECF subfamily)
MLRGSVKNVTRKHEQFERLAMPHRAHLFDLAKRLTGNETHAEDLLQDTYLKALLAFDSFDGSSKCKAWLKKIMTNTFINIYNRKKKVVFYLREDDELSNFAEKPVKKFPHKERIAQDTLLKNFVSDEVRKSLLSLSEEYRQTIILYDMLGFAYKEIADILSTPIGTVKSRLFRGRQLLKESLSKEMNGK